MPTDTPSTLKYPFGVLLSSDATGIVTWLGTVLTVVGLGFTFHQAREARRAASAAAEGATQAERAVRRIEHQTTLADAAHISAQIELIIHLIGSQQYHAIQLLFGMIKRHIIIMLVRSPPSDDKSEVIKVNLKAAHLQILKSINEPAKFKVSILSKALDGLSSTIVEWEQSLKSNSSLDKINEINR